MPVKCHVIDCSKPAVTKGLCDTHRKRLERHGHLDQTRPVDWGSREKHPAYRSWSGLIRYHKLNTCSEWVSDFWAFANSIPEKPSSEAKAHRPDSNKPWEVVKACELIGTLKGLSADEVGSTATDNLRRLTEQ